MSHELLAIERKPTVGEIISCESFSTLQRLLRVTAYVQKAVSMFKRSENDLNLPVSLTPQEVATAE